MEIWGSQAAIKTFMSPLINKKKNCFCYLIEQMIPTSFQIDDAPFWCLSWLIC